MKPPRTRYTTQLLKSALFGGLFIATAILGDAQQLNHDHARVDNLLRQMTLQEKLDYLHGVAPAPGLPNSTGASIAAIPRLGLPEIRTTDASMGVRSEVPSTAYPASILLAASWNADRAQEEGESMARDARARGFHILLGPGVNIYRVPIGGRNSEYCSGEDPYLGSQIAVPMIEGLQHGGVMANAKHYDANNQEFKRNSINEFIDQRTLREIYLPAFESAVRVGRVGSLMPAYNQVNGLFCAQNWFLLTQVLVDDWGFKGIRLSDWGAVHDGLQAALAGTDLEMPGNPKSSMNYATLSPYVQSGLLPLPTVDDHVRRILRGIVRFGFLDRPQYDPSLPKDDPRSAQAGLDTAREGITLLKNEQGVLPLGPDRVKSVAVVGRYANGAPPAEGGSGHVTPIHYTSELDGITQAGSGVRVEFLEGVGNLDFSVATFQHTAGDGTTSSGLEAEYFSNQDLSGTPSLTRVETHLNAVYPTDLPSQVAGTPFSARWTGAILAPTTGTYALKWQYDSNTRLYLDGKLAFDAWDASNTGLFGFGVNGAFTTEVTLQAGQPLSVVVEYKATGVVNPVAGFLPTPSVGLAWTSLDAPPNLGTYDAVVVLAGFDRSYESEGADRTYVLPEFQDELIQNLAKANLHTVAVLHGGGGMDVQQWIGQVPAVLDAYFPGEDGGQAIGEVLFGKVNPSGKLPFTFEKRFEDNPAYASYAAALASGTTAVYQEGIFVGYRGFDKNGVEPQFEFGYGLSYTSFDYSDLAVSDGGLSAEGKATVSFTVTNSGKQAGAETAQLYAGKDDSKVIRPVRELKGFRKVWLQPGESTRVSLELDQRSLAYFDLNTGEWAAEGGEYDLWVGASSRDLRLSGKVENHVPEHLRWDPSQISPIAQQAR